MIRTQFKKFGHYFIDHHNYKPIMPYSAQLVKKQESSIIDNIWSNQYNINISNFSFKYINQVLAVLLNPELETHPDILAESVKKANEFKVKHNFKIGAYTASRGNDIFVNYVNDYINQRDSTRDSKPEDVILTNGGNNGYKLILNSLMNKGEGILMPSPCHPLIMTRNAISGINSVRYDLDFDTWDLNIAKLQEAFDKAKKKGTKPRALYVHNPHFPTGKVLSEDQMTEVVKFCVHNELFLVANESQQTNVHKKKFVSFRRVIKNLPSPYDKLELASIFSLGNGTFIQQSIKAGFCDFLNIDPEVTAQIYKMRTMDLCSSSSGQLMLSLSIADIRKEGFKDDFCSKFENSVANNIEFNLKALELFHFKIKMLGFKCDFPDAGVMFFANSSEISDYKEKLFPNKVNGSNFGTNPELKNYSVLHMSK